MLKDLIKDKFTLSALVILVLLYLSIAFADFIAPYSKDYFDRTQTYAPPSQIYLIDENGHFSLPYTYNYKRTFEPKLYQTIYTLDRSKKHYLLLFCQGSEYRILGLFKTNIHLFGTDRDGNLHLLGTDINGRDVFSRLLFGGRISLTIGFLSLLILFPIGLLYGGISGYLGGWVDVIMMRFAESVMAIPSFYLLIILASILPANMTSTQRFTLIVVILALIGWAGFARVVRGMTLSIKNEEYVQAAKTIGASKLRIILSHILPQTTGYVIIAMTLSVPSYILSESGLSFLGLGIQQPDASWGNMLKEAQEFSNILYRPWLLTPGLLIFVSVLCFNIIGDSIRDILDPKGKMRG